MIVEKFIVHGFPKIQGEHQSKINDGYKHGYELDPDFIQVTEYKKILDLIAQHQALDTLAAWLKGMKNDNNLGYIN